MRKASATTHRASLQLSGPGCQSAALHTKLLSAAHLSMHSCLLPAVTLVCR